MVPKESRKPVAVSIIFGFVIAFVALGLPMIGVTVNLWLGSIALLVAFALFAYGFVRWEKISHWRKWLRTSTLCLAAICYLTLVGFQIKAQYSKDHAAISPSATPPVAQSMQPHAPSAIGSQEPRPTPSTNTVHKAEPTPQVRRPAQPPARSRGSLIQSNSGSGINIQQGTIGNQSPIINSPITVGNVPRRVPKQDVADLAEFFSHCQQKMAVEVVADQDSNSAGLPSDLYRALSDGGWPMKERGVEQIIAFGAPGPRFQGVVVTIHGAPLKPNEMLPIGTDDALGCIGAALQRLQVPHILRRDMSVAEETVILQFEGGLPEPKETP